MTKNESQNAFWTISIFYWSMFDGLKSYLNSISQFLDQVSVQLKQYEPPTGGEAEIEHSIAIERFEEQFPTLLTSSFIITLVSTLERELSKYCDTAARFSNIRIRLSDLRGSFHDQFKNYLSNVVKMSFDFQSDNWKDIKGLIEVRNAIVHNDGILEDSSRANTIRNLNKRYPTLTIKGEVVEPTMLFCNQMIQVVHDFLVSLTDAAYEHYK